MGEFFAGMFVGFIVVFMGTVLAAPYTGGMEETCHQWAGKSAVIYDGKCMVRTKDGGLRPARKESQ